jgi:hypothetical protein
LKGLIHGLDIETKEIGTALVVSEQDIERMRERIASRMPGRKAGAAKSK